MIKNLVFDFIYPDSSIFLKSRYLQMAVDEHHLNKDKTAYVGDEDRDVEAAKKVGLNRLPYLGDLIQKTY